MKAILAAVALTGTAVLAAAPAHADQYEFISMIDNHGVSYASVSDMIDIGKATCHELRSNYPIATTGNNLVALGFPPIEAALIITAASWNMCPDTWWRVEDSQQRERQVA